MSTLTEIEAKIEKLSPSDMQELLLLLAERLRKQSGPLPPPRKFSSQQIQEWIVEDEAGMQRFLDCKPQ